MVEDTVTETDRTCCLPVVILRNLPWVELALTTFHLAHKCKKI